MQTEDFEKMSKANLVQALKKLQRQNNDLMQKCTNQKGDTRTSEFEKDNFYNFIEHSGDAIYLCDLDGHILMTNSRSCEMLNYTKEEFRTKKVSDLDANYKLQQQKDLWNKLQSNRFSKVETVHKSKQGILIPVELRIGLYKADNQNYIIGFARDIRDKKNAIDELYNEELKFKLLSQQAPFVVEIYDINGLQVEVNHAYELLWGFPAATTLNTFNVLQSKEVADSGLLEYVKRAYAGESVNVPEYRFNPKGETEAKGSGRVRWLSSRIFPLKDKNDIVINIVIVHQDISEHRQAMLSLSKSEKRFKNFVLQVPFPLSNVNITTGEIILLNERFIKTFGYSRHDIPNISDWWHKAYPDPEYMKWVMQNWKASMDFAIQHNTDIKPATYNVRCKNGKVKHVIISGILLGEDSLITFIDISAQMIAEAELKKHRQHLEKLVRERTQNLEDKNKQLERFNDLFVDREFRIKELKEEIKRLKNLK